MRVDKDEGDEYEPEEGEGIKLEVGEEGESEHLQEAFFLRWDIFMKEAACKRRLILELIHHVLSHFFDF